ncbi:MAG: energy transducer TonB [Candidatus Korobacteraceae bacterium]
MSSSWPSALAALDDSLSLPCASVGELKAAKPVDVEEVIQQLKMAAESAHDLRALISSELPGATWENREELDALIEEMRMREQARKLEQLRARLLDLATDLERGEIVHRRALRVQEVSQLRDQAIKELRTKALEEAPQTLPGPDASKWIQWACHLQEPDDTESLEGLRNGFPQLDDFVANLEPDMWRAKAREAASPDQEEAEKGQKSLEAEASEQKRSRLLALAMELERGSIVHHRAVRVNELNQLRDQAVEELRSQAGSQAAPQTLPGPDAEEWVQWACSLQEPEDTEALQTLRNGFAHLDDFIANLELKMWRAEGPATVETQPARSADDNHHEESALEANGFEEFVMSAGPIPIGSKAAKPSGGRDGERGRPQPSSRSTLEAETFRPTPARTEAEMQQMQAQERALLARIRGVAEQAGNFDHGSASAVTGDAFHATAAAPAMAREPVEPVVVEEEDFLETPAAPASAKQRTGPSLSARALRAMSAAQAGVSDIKSRAEELLPEKWRLPAVAAAVLVLLLVVAGVMYWRLHRVHASGGPVNAVEGTKLTPGSIANQGNAEPAASIGSQTQASSPKPQTEKPPKPKYQSAAANPPAPTEPTRVASKLDDALRLPATIPKTAPTVNKEDAPPSVATGVPGSVPGGVPSALPNTVIDVVRSIPATDANVAPRKVTVSSGVAQGLLVHQVAPQYPAQAKQLGIAGTVVLQVVIGKDGTVHDVRALRGNPMLTQAAVDAVKQWRYRPYSLNGEPVEADTQISVKFTPH